VITAGDDLKHGRLIKAFDFSGDLDTGYWVVYGKGALRQPKVKAFRDWVMEQAHGHVESCKDCG
jgi:LysR family glycine cleavage system transcriptional activator